MLHYIKKKVKKIANIAERATFCTACGVGMWVVIAHHFIRCRRTKNYKEN